MEVRNRNLIQLPTGQLEFELTTPDGVKQTWRCDTVEIKLLCEELEGKHALKPDDDGLLIPTSSFIDDLKGRLSKLDLTDCTSTVALSVWKSVNFAFWQQHEFISDQVDQITTQEPSDSDIRNPEG